MQERYTDDQPNPGWGEICRSCQYRDRKKVDSSFPCQLVSTPLYSATIYGPALRRSIEEVYGQEIEVEECDNYIEIDPQTHKLREAQDLPLMTSAQLPISKN